MAIENTAEKPHSQRGRPKGSVSQKKAINLIRKHGYSTMRSLLRGVKQLEALTETSQSKDDLIKLIQIQLEILPFIVPKQMAVAGGALDDEGMMISPVRLVELQQIAREIQEAERKQLTEGNEIGALSSLHAAQESPAEPAEATQ